MAHSAPPLIPEEVEEVRSQRTPAPPPNTEGEVDAVMAEVNTSVTKDQGGSLTVNKEGDLSQSEPSRKMAPEPQAPGSINSALH